MNKIEVVNDKYIEKLFKKFNLEISYTFINHKSAYPIVIDHNTELTHYNRNFTSRDKRMLMYNGYAYANFLLMDSGVITKEQKEEYDKLLENFYYCKQCYS